MADDALGPPGPRLRPAEFCALERQLIAAMAMRKKRNLEMAPMQALKTQLLELLERADPEPEQFTAALLSAVHEVSGGLATGPAQAVASDLEMDWELACGNAGFVDWLRSEASAPPRKRASPNG